MELLTLAIGLLSIVAFIYFMLIKKRPPNFPPGPRPIPLFGNAFQLGDRQHLAAAEYGKIHGPILGFQLGSYWWVVLNDAEDIREMLSKPQLAGRHGYNPFLEENVRLDSKGILQSQGQEWQDVRRFSLKVLRDFGFGKRSMESILEREVEELLEVIRKDLGKPVSTQGLFNSSVLNVIWSIVAGERFKFGDERLTDLLRLINQLVTGSFEGSKILNFMFPSVAEFRKKFSWLFPEDNSKLFAQLRNFLQKTVTEHRETMQIGQPRDFIDSFLEESIKREGNPTDHFGRPNDDSGLIITLMDLFGAGSDTTSQTLRWAFFLLGLHPEEEVKLYEELESVVGNRSVHLEDRVNLPRTEAVMAEVYRVSSLVAIGSPRAATEDLTFKGYKIAKNVMVFGNLYAAHFNKKTWGDPENFRPDRFLSPDKKTFVRNPNLLNFGYGRRVCLGETLARDEFFIFLTNIVQQLKVRMPPDEPKHSMVGIAGIVLTPEPHNLIFTDRNA